MTSRKKILNLTKAAKRLSCSVVLKTGGPPGIMIAEGESEAARDWLETVRKLRYKDFHLLKKEQVDRARLDVPQGVVKELTSMKELAAFLAQDENLDGWWRVNMGFKSDDTS